MTNRFRELDPERWPSRPSSGTFAYFIEFLEPKLGEQHAAVRTAIIAALNDRAKFPELERFANEWTSQLPVGLDVEWPKKS